MYTNKAGQGQKNSYHKTRVKPAARALAQLLSTPPGAGLVRRRFRVRGRPAPRSAAWAPGRRRAAGAAGCGSREAARGVGGDGELGAGGRGDRHGKRAGRGPRSGSGGDGAAECPGARAATPAPRGGRAGGGLAGGRRAVPGPPPTPRGAGRRGRDRRGARDPGGAGLRLVSPLPSPPTAVTGEWLGLVPHLPEGVRVGLGAGAKARGEASVLAAVPRRPPVCGLRGRVAGAGRPRGPWAG